MFWFKKTIKNEEKTYVHQKTESEILLEKIKESFNEMIRSSMDSSLKELTGVTENISTLQSEIKKLKKQKEELEDEIRKAKKDKEMESLETEHLVKLKEERMKLESDKKEVELEKKYQEKEMVLMKKNFKNILETIEKQQADTKELYKNIMTALPNVNYDITKEM